MIKIKKMDNGLRIVTYELPSAKSVSISIWVKIGSRYEKEDEHGITHFIEHLVFKGTKKRRNSFCIANEIERVGGDINGETSREYTGYTVKIPYNYFSLGLDILSDILCNPLFRQKDILKEGNVVLEEISTYKDTPSEFVYDLLGELMWANQPLGKSELGTQETISKINRDQIIDYMNKYYVPSNMVISIVGNVSHDVGIAEVKRYIDIQKTSHKPRFQKAIEKQNKPEILLKRKQSDEAHLCFGIRTIPLRDPEYYVQKIIDVILGTGMSSRLFQELRDKKGLAYNVTSNTASFQDTGALIIYAGVALAKVKEAIEIVLQEIRKIRNGHISEAELFNAKEYYKGALALNLEDTLEMSEWLGTNLLLKDEIPSLETTFAKIDKVELDDIIGFSQKYFIDKNLNLVIIGPFENEDNFRQILII